MAKKSESPESSIPFPAPWDRIFATALRVIAWVLLFSVIYILQSFFLLVFLTFVFSYIQANGVERLSPRVKNRSLAVVIVTAIFLSVIVAVGLFLVPKVKEQANLFATRFPEYVRTLDEKISSLSANYPVVQDLLPELNNVNIVSQSEDLKESYNWKGGPTAGLIQRLMGGGESKEDQQSLTSALDTVRNIGTKLAAVISAFLLSLLFSFLIVLDLPRLSASLTSLKDTKLSFIYSEVADSILSFCSILGRALEAQLFIALLNTLLTASGVYLLGLGRDVAFLSVVVFICSFIPIAGVFISSVPICLLALQDAGLPTMLLAIVLITVVHLIECYILNPRIYGHHLRMNPVVVLIILTIGGKLFNVWGLVLGVPICNYIFGYAIRYPEAEKR